MVLYILRRKALSIPFWICVKKPPQALKACRMLGIVSARNAVYKIQLCGSFQTLLYKRRVVIKNARQMCMHVSLLAA